MKYKWEAVIASLGTSLVAIAIVAAITYGCTRSNERYYATMNSCIDHGGSWVPTGDHGACISPRRTEP